MSDPAGRRYSEREFALILRKASELHREEGEPGPGGSGMTLAEIQQVAEEAGFDPALVARAASLLGHRGIGERRRILGPSGTVHISSSVEGELTPDDMRRLMEIVRYETSKPGSLHEVMGSVAWKSDGQEAPLEVRVTPAGGRSTIEILSRSQTYKTLTYTLSATAGFLASITTMPLLTESKPLVLLVGFLVGPALGFLAGRPFWNWWSARWRARLADLLDTLRQEAQRRALLPPPGDDTRAG